MTNPSPDSKILGRLLMLQSMLQAAPDKIRLGELVCSALRDIPGILATVLFVDQASIACSPPCPLLPEPWPPEWEWVEKRATEKQDTGIRSPFLLSVQTNRAIHGHLAIFLGDHPSFQVYLPYIENTINFVALILENWKNEQELHQEKDFLKAILDNIADGIVACDENGVLTLFNKATRKIHGLPERSLPPEEWAEYYDLFLADGKTRMTKEEIPLYRAFTGEYCRNLEMVIAPRHGSPRTLVAAGQPLLDHACRIIGAVASMHDITDRKMAEEKLKKAYDLLEIKVEERTSELRQSYEQLTRETRERKKIEKRLRQAHKMEAIGTIAGGIAHDFNNILSIILGNLELAMEDIPKWNPAFNNLEEILSAGMRARAIVRQLLSATRKTEKGKAFMDLRSIVENSLERIQLSLPADIRMEKSLGHGASMIRVDPAQIHQMLLHLCINAAQAMEEGGTLTIGLSEVEADSDSAGLLEEVPPGRYAGLTVSDTGHGIDPSIMDKIFDPYFTTQESGKGSGMGLAVVHGIVKSHGGHISVASEPGQGSRFRILFPCVEENQQLEREES